MDLHKTNKLYVYSLIKLIKFKEAIDNEQKHIYWTPYVYDFFLFLDLFLKYSSCIHIII